MPCPPFIRREEARAQRANGRGIQMQNPPLSGEAILVVEDEPLIALDLRQTLESAGAYVFAATQLSHALQLAGHPDISAAVLDYRLGDGDCTPICTLLSQRGIPFVFYSGYDDVRQNWPDAAHAKTRRCSHNRDGRCRGLRKHAYVNCPGRLKHFRVSSS